MKVFVFACFVVACAANDAAANPLGKVIDLMDELSAKVTADGEAEAKSYHDYFEWCDETAATTANQIKTAKSQKAKLEATIAELSSNIEVSTSKVEELAGAIAESSADLKEATRVRETEAVDFAAGEKELVGVVDTLDRAINILSRGASLAQVDGDTMASLLQSVSAVVDAAAFSNSDKSKLLALVQSHDGDGEFGAPAAAVYKSHGSGILELLEDLKDKAEVELSDLRKAEAKTKHNYDMLRQSLEAQEAQDTKHMDAEKASKAAAEEGKAGAEADLTTTVEELKMAEEELEKVRAGCMTVAADHEVSIRSRAEELKVIAQAKKILEDTSSGAVAQTYSFVQVSQGVAQTEVVGFVKRLAERQHSAALAQLASRIASVVRYSTGNKGPFGKVKELIEAMIVKLEKEGEEAATEKAWCDEQTAKTEAKKGELEDDESKLSTKIDQASAKSADLKEEVKGLQADIAALVKEQAEMDKMRQEEHADYAVAKADLELGVGGVRKALDVLRDYYAADAGDDAALMQQPAKPVSFSKAEGAGTSIIGILEVCESDFATGLAKTESEEADAASAYEKDTQENAVVKATKEQDVKGKTQEYKALDKSIAEFSSDLEAVRTELSAVNEYYAEVNERCIAKPETYEARKARREAEINGLKEALSILENETALVQRKRRSFLGSLAPQ